MVRKEEDCLDFRLQTLCQRVVQCCLQMVSMQCVLLWMEKRYNGVCNVGVKPTFHDPSDRQAVVEVHVLDFDGDLYGKEASVDWIGHIRDEQKFGSIDLLVEQIAKDKNSAQEILEATSMIVAFQK